MVALVAPLSFDSLSVLWLVEGFSPLHFVCLPSSSSLLLSLDLGAMLFPVAETTCCFSSVTILISRASLHGGRPGGGHFSSHVSSR